MLLDRWVDEREESGGIAGGMGEKEKGGEG